MIPPEAYCEDVRCWKSQDDQRAPLARGSVVKNTGVTMTSKLNQKTSPAEQEVLG